MSSAVLHARWLLFILLLALSCLRPSENGALACIESEKESLLQLKSHLGNLYHSLDSWINDTRSNCCSWEGVQCSNTGYIIGLDFNSKNLSGPLGRLPGWTGGLPNLRVLDLSVTGLSGHLPDWIRGLQNLRELYISDTGLFGRLPGWIGGLRNLSLLDLSSNSLSGPIPNSIRELVNLKSLYLGSNFFDGVLTEVHLSNLTNLKYLGIENNPQLAVYMDPNWQPPFQLKLIEFSSCKIGPEFPLWLCNQTDLYILRMERANISDSIPECFWNSSTHLTYLFLQQNELKGKIKPFISKELEVLDLSSNNLFGSIPDSWNGTNLNYLLLSNNYLSGTIPKSIFASALRLLHLRSNNLTGGIPLSLRNSKDLVILDLSFNSFNGYIPDWLGGSLPNLKILQLKWNNFVGTIPPQLSNLSALQILDLSHNNLYGTIPRSFGMLSTMRFSYNGNLIYDDTSILDYVEGMSLEIKGSDEFYINNQLRFMISLDLSDNGLNGTIPAELVNLGALVSLNLSHNNLIGGIDRHIDKLHHLESLDLSGNKLSGVIPSSLARLNFLSHLNLSYNNFSGRIPFLGQLQTLDDPFIYIGNDGVCGLPLSTSCIDDSRTFKGPSNYDIVEQTEALWFYLGIAPGFVVGFWAVCGSLLIKQSWRISFFRFVDNIYAMFVGVIVSIAMMK